MSEKSNYLAGEVFASMLNVVEKDESEIVRLTNALAAKDKVIETLQNEIRRLSGILEEHQTSTDDMFNKAANDFAQNG